MLTVSGLVVVPPEPQLKEADTDSGHYFDFLVTSEEDREGNAIYHRYHINMWVPKTDVAKWRKRIQPGKVFFIQTAKISSELKDGYKFPLTTIKVFYKEFKPLAVPFWHESKVEEE